MRWRIFRGIDESVYPMLLVSEWRTESEAGLDGIVGAVEDADWPRESELLLEYRDLRLEDYQAYWEGVLGQNKAVPMDVDSIRTYIGKNRLLEDFEAFGRAHPRLATDFLDAAGLRKYLIEVNLVPLMEKLRCQCLCVYRDFDRHGIMMTRGD